MTIKPIISHGVLLIGFILMAAKRVRRRPRPLSTEKRIMEVSDTIHCRPNPESDTLAGVPRRVLLSERSGPGALLRDTLMIRPSGKDH